VWTFQIGCSIVFPDGCSSSAIQQGTGKVVKQRVCQQTTILRAPAGRSRLPIPTQPDEMSSTAILPGLYQDAGNIERWNQESQQADQRDQQGLAVASNGQMPTPAAAEHTGPMQEAPVSPQQKQQTQLGHHQHDMEGIRGAFSPVAVFGIRSLPDALHPGYRQELLLQLQAAGEGLVSSLCPQAHANLSVVSISRSPPTPASLTPQTPVYLNMFAHQPVSCCLPCRLPCACREAAAAQQQSWFQLRPAAAHRRQQ
jgi:hypothetical protein